MKRILVAQIPEAGQIVEPEPEEAHHLTRVRRSQHGETVEVLDGKGGLAVGKLLIAGKKITVEIEKHLSETRESPLHLELVLAIPERRATIDELLPSLVQLGLNSLYLVPTTHGGRLKKDPEKYLNRLDTIALQSIKQCGRTITPKIEVIATWPDACHRIIKQNQANILFHPTKQSVIYPVTCNSLGLFIGPEGGFTEEEVTTASEIGITIKGMGPRILKTETAAIGACCQAQTHLGDLA